MRFLIRSGLCTSILVASVAAAALTGCGSFDAADSTDTPEPDTTQAETARSFFDRFPSGDYESFAEAETAAGFHIPRPSAEFPNLHGSTTHLQWLPRVSAPVSKSYYGPIPGGPVERDDLYVRHIWLRVAVSGLFSEGDLTMMQGAQMRLGGKDGWLGESPDGVTRLFNYVCGSLNAETLWCTVASATEIDQEIFDRFVESLE